MMEAASQPTWALVPSLAGDPACPHLPTPGRQVSAGAESGPAGELKGHWGDTAGWQFSCVVRTGSSIIALGDILAIRGICHQDHLSTLIKPHLLPGEQ